MRLACSLIAAGILAAPAAASQDIPLPALDVKRVEALARSDSNDAEIQFYLALANWKEHRWRQVDSLLRLTVQLEPRYAEAYLALYYLPFARRPSLFREEERDHVPEAWRQAVEDAHRFYQRAFRTNPLVSLRVIGVALEVEEPKFNDYTSEEYQEYQRYYAWLVDLGLARYTSAYNRLRKLGQTMFDEQKHPDKVPDAILWFRGLAAAHSGQYDAAIADFQALLDRALKQQQKTEIVNVPLRDNEYRFMLAVLHHMAGHRARAAALYQKALEHALGLVMAHTYLAVLHDKAGEADQALLERQRAAESSGDDPTALFDYAAALFNVQRTAEAEDPLRRAVALNPRYAPTHYLLGRVAEELGRGPEARESYTRFLALAPNRLADLVADARERLAKLPQ